MSVKLGEGLSKTSDLRLSEGSPAIDAGLAFPADWPDPFQEADKGKPDIGAFRSA